MERRHERAPTRTVGVDQRPVDVEKHEDGFHPVILARSRGGLADPATERGPILVLGSARPRGHNRASMQVAPRLVQVAQRADEVRTPGDRIDGVERLLVARDDRLGDLVLSVPAIEARVARTRSTRPSPRTSDNHEAAGPKDQNG